MQLLFKFDQKDLHPILLFNKLDINLNVNHASAGTQYYKNVHVHVATQFAEVKQLNTDKLINM